jgi:hypothetical protein
MIIMLSVTITEWARENGCPWNKKDCMDIAKHYERLEILKWILDH